MKAEMTATPRGRRRPYTVGGLVLFLIIFTGTACSGHYLRNRLRDAGDVFTGEVQTGAYGAGARMGPLKAGVYYKAPAGKAYGLRGGYFGAQNTAEFTALLFGADYHMSRPMKDLLPPDKKKKSTKDKKAISKPVNSPAAGNNIFAVPAGENQDPLVAEIIRRAGSGGTKGGPGAKKRKAVTGPALLEARRKQFRAYAPMGTRASARKYRSLLKTRKRQGKPRFVTGHYYTQFEVSLGIFGGLKLGFNPGELLDFFLGFLTIDIYGDDAPYPDPLLKRLRANPAWQQLDEATRQKILRDLSR